MQELNVMELLILKVWRWNVCVVTSAHFIPFYTRVARVYDTVMPEPNESVRLHRSPAFSRLAPSQLLPPLAAQFRLVLRLSLSQCSPLSRRCCLSPLSPIIFVSWHSSHILQSMGLLFAQIMQPEEGSVDIGLTDPVTRLALCIAEGASLDATAMQYVSPTSLH